MTDSSEQMQGPKKYEQFLSTVKKLVEFENAGQRMGHFLYP
ncbi:MAG: hypothetical protein Q8P56_03970 [Candidatus Uhrbacteria bacterium]|nr:hypothetical protein [Candidatus Uhrbacteria bacterium]